MLLGLFFYMAGPGLGSTGDSFHYLATARNLRETGDLTDLDGQPYRYWGPLYPALLAVFFAPWAVFVLHAAALLGSLLIWSRLGEKLLPKSRVVWLPLLLALSTAVLVPAKFVWAEAVFGLLAAGYFFSLISWLQTGQAGWLGWATAAGFLLPLQRTSGFFLLVGAGVGLMATGATRARWQPLLLHGLACVSGGLAWNYYAEVVAGPPVYQAVGGWAKLGSSTADYGFVVLRWFMPLATSWRGHLPGLWAAGLVAVLALLWPMQRGLRTIQLNSSTRTDSSASAVSLRLLWWVLFVDVLAHLLATNLARGAAGLHDAERYLAALAGPVLLLGLARWPASVRHTGVAGLGRWLLAGWLGYSAVRVGYNAHKLRQRPPVAWPGPSNNPVKAGLPSAQRPTGRGIGPATRLLLIPNQAPAPPPQFRPGA